ncbi:hypothetical protein EV121DRAFT_216323 [Schizophyllum commune]
MQSTESSAPVIPHGIYYVDEGDCVARVENTLFRFHSSHLQRDTTYFDNIVVELKSSLGESPVGSTDDNPLALDDVRAQDFENLLWFSYESAYKWSDPVDTTLTPKWESILALAEKFGMRRIAKVACHALDSANALGDVRKIALAVKYGLGKEWVLEELKHTVTRDAPLSEDEKAEIGSPTLVAALTAAHGSLHPPPAVKASGCDPLDLEALECRARASEVFAGMISIPKSSDSATEGSSAAEPINVDVKTHLFRSFVWFIYESPYEWTHEVDPTSADHWENVLALADIFGMDEIARVAVYALDRHYNLSDIRKISLCVQYGIDISWAMETIKRVCLRKEPLSKAEARALGLDVAVDIAAARDAYKTKVSGISTPFPPRQALKNTLFRIHFYHLYRATSFFDKYIATLESPEGGYSEADPLLLDKVKARDFEHLLWFFYESAYKWSGIVDKESTVKWESILTLAEQYKMKEVAKVACYALGRANALGDVRKIALCVKYDMGKDWITEELVRIISRANPLSMDEAEEMGARMTAVLSKARESMRHMPSSDAIPACSRAQTADECRECYSRRDMVCEKGIHRCIWTTGHFTICPARDRSNIAAEIPDARTLVRDLHLPDSRPGGCFSAVLLLYKLMSSWAPLIENDVLSVHAYHLKRASQTFADMFSLPLTGTSSEGRSQDHPITLNVKGQQFKNFMWFLYESPYAWTYTPNPELTAKWEDILAVGDIFSMAEVCSGYGPQR